MLLITSLRFSSNFSVIPKNLSSPLINLNSKFQRLNISLKTLPKHFCIFARPFSTASLSSDQKKEAVIQDFSRHHAKVARTGRVKMDRTTKRFYKTVSVEESPTGWIIKLDNFKVLSSQDHLLNIPSQTLAFAIAAEWESQHTVIDLYRMPLFHLASTATDLTLNDADLFNSQILEVFDNDDFCVRDPLNNSTLGTIQQEQHQKFVEWFERHFDLPLTVDVHSNEFHQPQKTRTFLEKSISQLDDWALTGLHTLTTRLQSLVGALALWNYEFSIQQAVEAALIEQKINESKHGFVPGEHDLEKAFFFNEVAAATLFLHLLPTPPIDRQTLDFHRGIK